MANYKLEEVKTEYHRRLFRGLPKRLYRNDPNWVCPLDDDIEKVFDPARNELFVGGEAIRWILKDASGMVIARIGAFYNNDLATASEQPTGGCGFFECINDPEAAAILFDTAKYWLQSKGMEAMDGPINFGDRSDWWGCLVEGFVQPLYCNPYNFPYYKELFENYGFRNYFNQYTYSRQLSVGDLNPAIVEKATRLFNTPGYLFDYAQNKPLHEYADDFREIYNKGWANFTGVKPIDKLHAQQLFKKMKPIIDPRLLNFAYYENQPIGFFIMVPDLNRIIGKFNGKFGMLEKLRFMIDLKIRKKADRIFGIIFGVIPEFQGRGIEGGMICKFEEIVSTLGYKSLELAWIGDFNPVMMRMVESYVCARKLKTHVTYRYLFDREKEFTRTPKLGRERKKKNIT